MKKRLLSLLLAVVMLVSLMVGLGITASAEDVLLIAPAPAAPATTVIGNNDVTELKIGQNTVFVYAPQSMLSVSSTCTAPCFMVFGDKAYTADEVKAAAAMSGLEALAAAEGASIVFINPQGESWTDADAAAYAMLIDLYSNASTANFVGGIADVFNFMTGGSDRKILGDTGRVYIYGEGKGADFVAKNLMKKVVASVTYPDGFTMTFDRTPTSITLFNPTALPAASEPADIAVAVVNGPADAAEKLATLTKKAVVDTTLGTGFDAFWIRDNYKTISGAYRRQVGVLLPVHDWDAEGITETVKSLKFPGGRTMGYVVYHASAQNVHPTARKVPLVLTFHGGDNTALYQAQASEWPVIGKENGFITVAVDNHVAYSGTDIVILVNQLMKDYPIDASRIYASGFSMGSVKSWELFDNPLFAGVAPMSGSFQAPAGDPAGHIMPAFYVGGEASPLPELCHQGPDIINRVTYLMKANKIDANYKYDKSANLFWGANGDLVYKVSDKVAFKDSVLTVNLFKSEDGCYYTALASSGNMSHEVYARNSWAAWDFLKQFSRNEDGSVSIHAVDYTLASDDGAVVNNGYNK